ncbi:GNAT family N-acetyltransferase [uncultured Shewanella sp.]|uniref:GNAT family N-acetyltransferase n=1 Tax=uncultured Shewanella sp. TaxID=173975 RepID=UPI002632A673|nr:GNAT family N-acetyltransferase [uncultured Shewanella sp.]
MAIRQMTLEDIERVSELCLTSFMGAVAGTLSDEGVATFTNIASIEAFKKRMQENNTWFVYECTAENTTSSELVYQTCPVEKRIMGVLELKENKHISMLFVCPSAQRQGVGRALIAAACQHVWQDQTQVQTGSLQVDNPQVDSPQVDNPQGNSLQGDRVSQCEPLTVSASLTSVPAYLRYGFKVAGEIAESEGLTFRPMTLDLRMDMKIDIGIDVSTDTDVSM